MSETQFTPDRGASLRTSWMPHLKAETIEWFTPLCTKLRRRDQYHKIGSKVFTHKSSWPHGICTNVSVPFVMDFVEELHTGRAEGISFESGDEHFDEETKRVS